MAQGETVFLTIGFDLCNLLICGRVLARTARVADVGVYDGASRKGGGWGKMIQFTISD